MHPAAIPLQSMTYEIVMFLGVAFVGVQLFFAAVRPRIRTRRTK